MCDSTEPWKWGKIDIQEYYILKESIIGKIIIYEKVPQRGGGVNLFSYLYMSPFYETFS